MKNRRRSASSSQGESEGRLREPTGVPGADASCTAERVWRSHWAHGGAGAGMNRFEAASVEQGLLADGTQFAHTVTLLSMETESAGCTAAVPCAVQL